MSKVVCSVCGTEVHPCPARFDGEPTFVGFYPCPKHPKANVVYEPLIMKATVDLNDNGKTLSLKFLPSDNVE